MYQERIKKVLAAMEEMGLEQMLVSNPNSIWYLTDCRKRALNYLSKILISFYCIIQYRIMSVPSLSSVS